MNNFYVYCYKHPETLEPLYIGKGKNDRYKEHLYRAHDLKKRRRSRFLNKLVQIFNDTGKQALVEIHTSGLSEEESLALEVSLIAKYGRKDLDNNGILYNKTLGGDGISGYKWSDEQKKRFSENRKTKKHIMPQSTKKALLKSNIGRKMPKASIEATRKKKSKEWTLMNPNGERIQIKNLIQFCKINGLLVSGLRKTLETKKPVSRGPNTGWTLIAN